VRIASVAALGGLLFGYDSAVINGAVASISQDFNIEDARSLGLSIARQFAKQLGGGVTRSLALDAHGKCLSARLLTFVIE